MVFNIEVIFFPFKILVTVNQSVTQTTTCNEMEITETSHSIDPITKGPLIRPVRNRHCNHIYGYQSVLDSLAINRRLRYDIESHFLIFRDTNHSKTDSFTFTYNFRCPMAGCSNKQYVIEQDLIEL